MIEQDMRKVVAAVLLFALVFGFGVLFTPVVGEQVAAAGVIVVWLLIFSALT